MTNTSKKPVNDLIKFWAEKQDKDLEPIPRSPRRPLSPTSSVPPSPLNENFYSRSLFKDIPSNTPPLTPLHTPQNNLHSLISEEGDKNNFVDNGRSDSVSQSVSRADTPMEETSTNNTTNNKVVNNIDVATRDYFSRKPRDHDLNIKDNKTGHLPPVRKVTDLVSKFEKVASPNNSVQNSPRLTPVKRGQTFAQSSSTSRNQFTPEPISLNLPDPSIAKAKRRQTVPEPLNISIKKFIDEPSTSSPISQNLNKNCESTPISPISPIENLPTAVPNAQPISTLNLTDTKTTTTQTQKKQTYQEPFSNQSLKNDDDNQPKKNVSIELPVKESDPKPLQQQQQQQQELSSQPISLVQTDYLEFLSETFKNTTFDLSNQSNSANDLKYSSELGFILPGPTSVKKSTTESTKGNTLAPPLLKSISEKLIHTKQSKQSNTVSRSKTFPRITNNAHDTSKNSNNFETPDLLPQPEPISPIRLNFSDFLATPNGSTTNLNSDDKVNSEKPKKDGEKEKQNNPLIYKVVVESKSEVPKKNENSKSIRHISGSLQLFENLKRYLQPNKQKSSDDINPSTKKFTSQNFNDDNQLNQLY